MKRSTCASGSGIGAFGLDRVLRGHHQERAGHLVRFAGDGDLALLHHFQQRALHLGRGAVDFVGQQQVGEHRAQRGAELAGLLVVDAGAHQVGRHQVGRELDALELAAHGVGQRLDGQRLGQARHAFDQQVALGQHGDHHPFEETVLADHHPLDLVEDLFHQLGGALRPVGVVDSMSGGSRSKEGSSEGRQAGRGRRVLDRHSKADAEEGARRGRD